MNPPKCYTWLESYGSPLSDRKKKKYFLNSISRQNFANAFAETPNLNLEVCHSRLFPNSIATVLLRHWALRSIVPLKRIYHWFHNLLHLDHWSSGNINLIITTNVTNELELHEQCITIFALLFGFFSSPTLTRILKISPSQHIIISGRSSFQFRNHEKQFFGLFWGSFDFAHAGLWLPLRDSIFQPSCSSLLGLRNTLRGETTSNQR